MNLSKSKMTKGGIFTSYRGREKNHINLVGYTSSISIALISSQTFRSTSEGLFRKAFLNLL